MAKYSNLEEIRLEKIEALQKQGLDPYPRRVERTHTNLEAIQAFEEIENNEDAEPILATLVGRLRSMRPMGKLTFAHVEDGTSRIQFFFRANDIGADQVKFFDTKFDLGDFIQASGKIFRTRTGEITLWVSSFRMLSKAVTPLLPAKDEIVDGEIVQHATLADPETRYRQRYADLAVNAHVREIFRTRAKAIRALRDFLDARDFLEVETPILQPIYGGAAAQPFITHHNQLKQELYLRISFELYLKRLLVGGFERVYEIGRDFRNEGVSFKHNPEFTQLEFYMAYADYEDVMDLTEKMLSYVVKHVAGGQTLTYQGQEINFGIPWNRVELRQGLIDTTGIDISEHVTGHSLAEAMDGLDIEFNPNASRGKLIDVLLGHYLEPSFIQPTFLYNYPRDISPLAKTTPDDPQTVERFEFFIGGMEMGNAFTELNDPLDQEERFLEMGRAYDVEDEEHNPIDEDYLRAMRYGMPPNGGFGMGVDRLVMLLTDTSTIREVLLFPHLREREE